jgi:cell division septum initiation protein DivIVA
MNPSDQDPMVPAGMSAERAQEVRDFVDKISSASHELDLDDGSHEALREHITKIEEQLGADAPHHSVVDDAIEAMERLLGSSNTQKAAELLKEAGRFLTGVG